jgi:hypothetical protein
MESSPVAIRKAVAILAVCISSLSLSAQHVGCGEVYVNNYLPPVSYAPISMPNGEAPPPGAQAELVRVLDDGTEVPCPPIDSFRHVGSSPSEAWYFIGGMVVEVCGDVSPGQMATFRLRAWVGADWESASFRGESNDMTVMVGGFTILPPNLPIESFTLWPHLILTLSVPSGSLAIGLAGLQGPPGSSVVVVQTSTDLVTWEDLLSQRVSGTTVSVDVLANEEVRFYRAIRR